MGEISDEATLGDLIYDYLLGMDGIWMEYGWNMIWDDMDIFPEQMLISVEPPSANRWSDGLNVIPFWSTQNDWVYLGLASWRFNVNMVTMRASILQPENKYTLW